MRLEDWLPTPPWIGPPLPRWTGAKWPWVQSAGSSPTALADLFSGPPSSPAPPAPSSTYNNIAEIEFPEGFDPVTFMPRRIVVHRNSKVTYDQ